jgi:hypothetical protein
MAKQTFRKQQDGRGPAFSTKKIVERRLAVICLLPPGQSRDAAISVEAKS